MESSALRARGEHHASRHLLIAGLDLGQGTRLLAGLIRLALANRTFRAAASLLRLRCPRETNSLGTANPQAQNEHQDLNESLHAHNHTQAITVSREYFKSRDVWEYVAIALILTECFLGTCSVSYCVECRGFIERAERGSVETGLDKNVRGTIREHGHQSDVNDFSREFANDVDAE